MPHRYRDWKALAVGALSDQTKAHVLDTPITSATVQIELMGKHPRRGDLDNIAGSILDVLVQAGILRDDSISVVSSLSIALQYSTQSPIVQIQLGNLG
jgi:Holliday junction resolvase RusA-like endonuclease